VPVPDFIQRRLFPHERVIWLGKSRAGQMLLYLSPLIVAAIAWFGSIWFIARGDNVLSMALPTFVVWRLLWALSSVYVLTESRMIATSRFVPPFFSYVNLLNQSGAPVPIKLGWIDGVRFGPLLVSRRRFSGEITTLSVVALEDHKSVYDLAITAQRAAGRARDLIQRN
jgi:hypothetical protein